MGMAVIVGMTVIVGMAVIERLDGARCRSSTALAIHPTRITVDVMLFFPDRDAVFDLVDDPTTRAERLIAVRGCDAHPDGELAERQIPDTVHTTRVDDSEARAGLGHDALPLPQRQGLEGLVLQAMHRTAFIEVAHPALEGHIAAAGRIGERVLQGGRVERARAEGEAGLSHRPPAG